MKELKIFHNKTKNYFLISKFPFVQRDSKKLILKCDYIIEKTISFTYINEIQQ